MPQIAPKKATQNQIFAFIIVSLIMVVFVAVIWDIQNINTPRFYILLAIGSLVLYNVYRSLTNKYRHRNEILKKNFPTAWREVLRKYVAFYNALSKNEKHRFEQNVQIFLDEKRVTGIKTEINDTIRVLVAASAIIPIFGFREWEYDNLGEVLIYPHSFGKDFALEGEDRNVLGMVGTGVMSGLMILSKNALLKGFTNAKDGKNTAIHEFVHLIDAKDGDFDGIPDLLNKQYIVPWLDLMYQEIQKIQENTSSLNPYGATNEVEFFAVASEYFFEKPHSMQQKYPDLYKMLVRIFHQDLTNQFKYQLHDFVGYTGKKVGRNARCPCGSGLKYKKCCLK